MNYQLEMMQQEYCFYEQFGIFQVSFQYISFSFTRVICCFLKRKFCANVKKYHIGETCKCQPRIILKDHIICGQTSGFRSASHSPTLTFNTADRPHHPLPSHRQGSPQSSFNLHSCASSCGEYCGEDSIQEMLHLVGT